MLVNINSQLPTNRKFGFFFATIFMLLGIYAHLKVLDRLSIMAVILSFLFIATAIAMPQALKPLNYLWYKLGLILGRMVSPILLGVFFFLMITPIAVIMRFWGRDELRLKKRSLESYWVDRKPPGPSSDSFKNQY
jgi:hypothetical protein